MKKGMEIPPAVIIVVIIMIVAVIGYLGRNVLLPPQRVQMSPEAIKGMKEHTMSQGAGAHTPAPGKMSEHSSP